jgi:hypothetical protein
LQKDFHQLVEIHEIAYCMHFDVQVGPFEPGTNCRNSSQYSCQIPRSWTQHRCWDQHRNMQRSPYIEFDPLTCEKALDRDMISLYCISDLCTAISPLRVKDSSFHCNWGRVGFVGP